MFYSGKQTVNCFSIIVRYKYDKNLKQKIIKYLSKFKKKMLGRFCTTNQVFSEFHQMAFKYSFFTKLIMTTEKIMEKLCNSKNKYLIRLEVESNHQLIQVKYLHMS